METHYCMSILCLQDAHSCGFVVDCAAGHRAVVIQWKDIAQERCNGRTDGLETEVLKRRYSLRLFGTGWQSEIDGIVAARIERTGGASKQNPETLPLPHGFLVRVGEVRPIGLSTSGARALAGPETKILKRCSSIGFLWQSETDRIIGPWKKS